MKKQTKQKNIIPQIDLLIREEFQLFKNKRNPDADTKLYLAVYDRLFSEYLKFLEDELGYMNKVHLYRDIGYIQKAVTDENRKQEIVYTQLFKYVSYIPHGLLKLQRRLEHYIYNLSQQTSLKLP